jgi:hypothetical protein
MFLANPAALFELPLGDRPKRLVWTDERVRAWQQDFDTRLAAARAAAHGGRVSPVDIWIATPARRRSWSGPPPRPGSSSPAPPGTGCTPCDGYLTGGLRRGEGVGLRRRDTDLAAAITICWQITQLGWDPVQGPPKSDAGERDVALDADTVADIGT